MKAPQPYYITIQIEPFFYSVRKHKLMIPVNLWRKANEFSLFIQIDYRVIEQSNHLYVLLRPLAR